jgi:hypothetical protein
MAPATLGNGTCARQRGTTAAAEQTRRRLHAGGIGTEQRRDVGHESRLRRRKACTPGTGEEQQQALGARSQTANAAPVVPGDRGEVLGRNDAPDPFVHVQL